MATLKKLAPLLLALLAVFVFFPRQQQTPNATDDQKQTTVADDALRQLFERQQSDQLVEGEAIVQRVLPDDNNGDRHQRFIIATVSGVSVLIAHNIDLAPRLDGLRAGDRVGFRGEYEWNDKGGVIHWTHHDPKGRHDHGWLEWRGKRYQ